MKTDLIVLSGPSGVGKKTVVDAILAQSDRYVVSISATTRKPRAGEQEGKDYHFLSIRQFRKRIQENGFVEWAKVHGQYYGTPTKNVELARKHQQHLILEIDVQGGMAIKNRYGDQALLFFILPPTFEDLVIRLKKRGTESEEEIQKRMETAKLEIKYANEYDYRVINDQAERAAAEIVQIVESVEGRDCNEKKQRKSDID